ncbi:MAG: acetolactate synthase small subunit [Firmicutes bacterium]|nr:acetolactate synthase small subunit [Bacillota bacterium]
MNVINPANSWLISILVNNHFGVLTRVTALFSRRGYNIASLSVGETNQPEYSRITIETRTDGAAVRQIIKQLQKLEDVKAVSLLPGAERIVRDLLIIKLAVTLPRREALYQALSGFSYQIPYQDERRVVLEFTGSPEDCAQLLEVLSAYTVVELCRTGITAVSTLSELSAQ